MKLPCLTALAAAAAATVAGTECSQEQFLAYGKLDESPYETACPSLYLKGDDALNPSHLDTFTVASLKALEPCKEKTCLTQLQNFRNATPNCSLNGFNPQSLITVTMELCEAFNAGPVSVETAKSMFQGIEKSLADAFGSLLDNDGSEDPSGSAEAGVNDGKPSNTTTGNDTSTTTKPGAVPTPAPTTAKSDASAATVASLAVVATASLASTLLLQ